MNEADEDEELQRALLLSRQEAEERAPSDDATERDEAADVQVLCGYGSKFRCYAAAAASRSDLDATGKVLLPESCLTSLVKHLGELPATILLRLSLPAGPNQPLTRCFVGVAGATR